MKLTTKLMTLALGFTLPVAITSCGEKKIADAVNSAKEEAKEKAADALPTDAKGVANAALTQMEGINKQLESVTDVESAKKAIPQLEKIGEKMASLKALGEKFGGESKFNELVTSNPELKTRLETVTKGMMTKMMQLSKDQPEAAKLIGEAMNKVMK